MKVLLGFAALFYSKTEGFFSVLQKLLPYKDAAQVEHLKKTGKFGRSPFMLITLTKMVTGQKRLCWLYALLGDTFPCISESVYLIFQVFTHEY